MFPVPLKKPHSNILDIANHKIASTSLIKQEKVQPNKGCAINQSKQRSVSMIIAECNSELAAGWSDSSPGCYTEFTVHQCP